MSEDRALDAELLRTLAIEHGTPLYIFDGDVLERRLTAAASLGARYDIGLLYSLKANPNPEVLRRCLALGIGFDVCSPGDVDLATAAGAGPDVLSYTGIGLTRDALLELAKAGVQVNVDNEQELDRALSVDPPLDLGLRIAIDGSAAAFTAHCASGAWGGKFGIDRRDLGRLTARAASRGTPIRRLHAHLGSGIGAADPYLAALDVMLDLAWSHPDLDQLNMGGGFGAALKPSDAEFPLETLFRRCRTRLDAFAAATGRSLSLEFEPGDLLVSDAGFLLGSVLTTKRWEHAVRAAVTVVISDVTMNLHPSFSLYGSHIEVDVVQRQPHGQRTLVDIYGNLNQSGDQLCASRELPTPEPDDLLLFHNAGGYAFVRSTQFNQRPRPPEVWLSGPDRWVSRRGETTEELVQRFRVDPP